MKHASITFEKASLKHRDIIFSWLAEPHMQAHWDNSEAHRADILNFMHGRKQVYFYGTTQYWVGYLDMEPFCFVLTDEMLSTQPDLSDTHRAHLSATGHTITLDFGIGNKQLLGQGLAAITLLKFVDFYHAKVDPKADTFFIDPNVDNPRAFHVYEKAGFKMVGHYTATAGAFTDEKICLMVKKIRS